MRNILTLSALILSALATGCSSMPEQTAEARTYSPCKYMPTHPKCYGQSQMTKEVEQRKAYAAETLEREAIQRTAYRQNRDF